MKATLPAPYIIGRRMWHPEHSRAAYPTRESLMRDCIGVLRREIEAVRTAGAAVVQLDEPWLATLVDPRFRAEEGIEDIRYEMDLCADLLNQTLDGLRGIETSVHLCHAHFARQHKTEGSYDLIMPALARDPGRDHLARDGNTGGRGVLRAGPLPRHTAPWPRLHRPLRPPDRDRG